MAAMGKSLGARFLAQASARAGAHHWLMERLTSVALVPLTLWFVVSAVSLSGGGHEGVGDWPAAPVNNHPILPLVPAALWPAPPRAQVIVEDYVHGETSKLLALMAINFGTIALGLACAVAVLKVAFGS